MLYYAFSHLVMSDSFATPVDYSPSGCSVHGISVVGWPFPSQGDLPNPEIKPVSPALQDEFFFSLLSHQESPICYIMHLNFMDINVIK